MKAFRILSCLAALTVTLVSCKEATSEFHSTRFLPGNTNSIILYADQAEADTVAVFSTDSWTMTVNAPWFGVSPMSKTVKTTDDYVTNLHLSPGVNITGQTRQALLSVTTTEFMNVSCLIQQVPFLHITKPGRYETTQGETQFVLHLPAQNAQAEISFYVYNDGAALTTADAWLESLVRTDIASTATDSKRPVLHTYTAGIADNPSEQERRGTLRLTSAGVSSDIIVVQAGREAEIHQ